MGPDPYKEHTKRQTDKQDTEKYSIYRNTKKLKAA